MVVKEAHRKKQFDKWKSSQCSRRTHIKHSWLWHLASLLWFLKIKHGCWLKRCETAQQERKKRAWEGEGILQNHSIALRWWTTQLKFIPEMFVWISFCKKTINYLFLYLTPSLSLVFLLHLVYLQTWLSLQRVNHKVIHFISETWKGTETVITEYLNSQREHFSIKK